jgi:hypothetical protein
MFFPAHFTVIFFVVATFICSISNVLAAPIEDATLPVENVSSPVEDLTLSAVNPSVPAEDEVLPVENLSLPVDDAITPSENVSLPITGDDTGLDLDLDLNDSVALAATYSGWCKLSLF